MPSTGLASTWPADGPPRLWSRTLGDGYSGIAEENGILYTGYRRGSDDVVTALDAQSGKTIWETKYAAPFTNSWADGVGPGPYAMPQVIGDRIVAASGTGLHTLARQEDRQDRVDARSLQRVRRHAARCSATRRIALPYKDTLIVLVGGGGLLSRITGGGSAVIAFKQRDGAVAWKANSFDERAFVADADQRERTAAGGRAARGGSHRLQSGRRDSSSGGIRIRPATAWRSVNRCGAPTTSCSCHRRTAPAAARWNCVRRMDRRRCASCGHSPRIQSHFGTIIRRGDFVYLSSGHSGPAFMTAVNVKTGQVAWQQRGFAKAQLLYADGKFVMLDEDGTLALATATPQNFSVLAKAPLLKRIAWTPPTLVGTRLYVRDRNTIVALDLGAPKDRQPLDA